MAWSWRLGRIAGIDVFVHFTFFILLAYVAWVFYAEHGSWAEAIGGVVLVLCIFGIVVLHELGHALAARRYGIRTRYITLLPIGGLARLERIPDDPKQELVVAIAGPLVNVVLAILFFVLILGAEQAAALESFGEGIPALERIMQVGGSFLVQMLAVNVMLVLFNLLPAFPMDGGRVLRALLAMRMDYVQATNVAASIGQGMAVLFALIGLFAPQPFLVIIALFVWLGAAQEAAMAQMKSALAGIPIRRAMITDYQTLAPGDTLAVAVEHILAGFQQDFPVVEEGSLVGILTRADLLTALAQRGQDTPVALVMQKKFETADPQELLEGAVSRLQESGGRSLPVVRNGQLVGLLTADNLGEFLMIQAALKGKGKP